MTAAADPALVAHGRTMLFWHAERLYPETGEGLPLADLLAELGPVDRVAVRAYLSAALASMDEPDSPEGMAAPRSLSIRASRQ